jgi:hypothetical protein
MRSRLAPLLVACSCSPTIVTPPPPDASQYAGRAPVVVDPPPPSAVEPKGERPAEPPPPGKGGTGIVGPEGVAAFDALAPAELARLHRARVFFGHQSVGANLIGGARSLGFSFTPVSGVGQYASPVLGEAYVGENGAPLRKVSAFVDLVGGKKIGSKLDAAGFKFCYVDMRAAADLEPIESAYAAAIDDVRRQFPELRVFHVTTPLTTNEVAENRARLAFGEWLKRRYASSAVVFDLAAVESTRPDGLRCEVTGIPVLCDEYKEDSGHLGAKGSARAAGAFLYAIARAIGPE